MYYPNGDPLAIEAMYPFSLRMLQAIRTRTSLVFFFALALTAFVCFGSSAHAAPSGTMQLTGTFESGNLSGWTFDGSSQTMVVTSPVHSGTYAARMTAGPGGSPIYRTALVAGSAGEFRDGTEYWIGFSVRPETAFPSWGTLFQTHTVPHAESWDTCSAGKNPITVGMNGNTMTLNVISDNDKVNWQDGSAVGNKVVWSQAVTYGTWYSWVFRFIQSTGSNGVIEAWLNGTKVYSGTGQNRVVNDSCGSSAEPWSYLKVGIYRDQANQSTQTIEYDDVRIFKGTDGYIAVDPSGGNVPVQPPPPSATTTVTLTASPTSIASGNSSILTWTGTKVSTCLGNGFSTGGALQGSSSVTPAVTTTYSITCVGIDGTTVGASAVVNVTVPPPTVTITASPLHVNVGEPSTLTWSSTNAITCLATAGFSNGGALQGTKAVTPAITTTYSIMCLGVGGGAVSAHVTVTVGAITPPVDYLDVTPPTIPEGLTAVAVSPQQINLTWNPSADNVGVVGYRIYINGVQIIGHPVGSTTYQSIGLNPNTTYTYNVVAFDGAGNESAQSDPATATTPEELDPTIPTTPLNLTAVAVSPTQVNLSWTASTDDVRVVGYHVYRNGVLVATVTGTSYSDGDLRPGTSYAYTVDAYDKDGNVSPLTPRVIVVTPGLNAVGTAGTSSTTPTNVVATPRGPNEVILSWTASTGTGGIAGYDVYVNGMLVGKSATNSYTVTGLFPATNYRFEVVAHDTQGRESPRSTMASAMTQDGSDTSGLADDAARAAGDAGEVASPLIQNNFVCFILTILRAVMYILFPVIVMMFAYTGFLFVSAQGNESKLTEAKRALFWTVIGALVFLGALVLTFAVKATVDHFLVRPGAELVC
jgi:chitodextrinase